MPAAKNNKKAATTQNKNKSTKNSPKKATNTQPKLTKAEQKKLDERKEALKAEVLAIILFGISIIIFVCVIASAKMGIVGGYVSAGLKHLFGIGAVILPVVLMIFSVQTFMDKTKYAYKFKLTLFLCFFLTIICIAHVFTYSQGIGDIPFSQYISDSFFNGSVKNGGFMGALIGGALCALIGKTGTTILLFIIGIILIVLATGKTVADFLNALGDWIDGTKEEFNDYRESHRIIDEEDDDVYYVPEKEPVQMKLPLEKMQKKDRTKNSPVSIEISEETGEKEESIIINENLSIDNRGYSNYSDDDNIIIPSFIRDDLNKYNEALQETADKNDDISVPEEESIINIEPEITATEEKHPEKATDETIEDNDTPPWEESTVEPTIIEAEKTKEINKLNTKTSTPYKFPSPSLLSKNPNRNNAADRNELIRKSALLKETLHTFGVDVTVDKISQGPAVTRYELIPPKGIPISRITKLDKDIELAMAAKSVRIEAPIPGTNRIGIELGNDTVSPVYFSEVLLTDKFRDYKSKLAFGIGKDITGTVIVADIADMTHLLIAGATGAGKSVCINTLITSILYKATPDEVKLIMIDPKKVELSVYNGIPHLLIPVVSDVQKAAGALNWAIREMERRYDLLEKYGVRNIKGYNKLPDIEKLPYIVIIVDELADLMMTTGKEVENAIVRLTQLARAAGMHLVIATQRPDANIVTGLIKANVPSRIAFKVAGSVNSKIILDATGAEKLLGRGDMLLKTRAFDDKPLRIQGAFVTDEEVEAIVDSIKTDESHYDKSVIDEINRSVAEAHGEESSHNDSSDGSDSLIDEAIKLVVTQQKASTSFIQRKFKIGYNRAARIVDELEERGIVGPDLGGTKGREVKLDKYQYNEWKNRQDSYDD